MSLSSSIWFDYSWIGLFWTGEVWDRRRGGPRHPVRELRNSCFRVESSPCLGAELTCPACSDTSFDSSDCFASCAFPRCVWSYQLSAHQYRSHSIAAISEKHSPLRRWYCWGRRRTPTCSLSWASGHPWSIAGACAPCSHCWAAFHVSHLFGKRSSLSCCRTVVGWSNVGPRHYFRWHWEVRRHADYNNGTCCLHLFFSDCVGMLIDSFDFWRLGRCEYWVCYSARQSIAGSFAGRRRSSYRRADRILLLDQEHQDSEN